MRMVPFHERFLEVAKRESRSLHMRGNDRIPDGDYLLMEAYCTDPKCDCRRVVLRVLNTATGEVAATIGLGFDPTTPMSAPLLDPLNPQSAYARDVLRLLCEIAFDAEYLGRLERHYRMMKGAAQDSREDSSPWWKRKRKKPKRRGGSGPNPSSA